jgi:hypothetical protein
MNISESMVTWEKTPGSVKVIFTLEYIADKDDWEHICSGKNESIEPWERYRKIKYEDFGTAILRYAEMSLSEKIYDVRIFMEIMLNGEKIAEYDIPCGMPNIHELADEATRITAKRNMFFNEERKEYINTIATYEDFIKKYKAETMLKEFIEERRRKQD